MAKSIRSIKNDLCRDETLGTVSRDARYLFVGLITVADDHGRFRAHPSLVRSSVYPYDDDVTAGMVAGWLAELEQAGRVRLYRVDGQSYGVLVNWGKHQRIDNAARSELPPPPDADTDVPAEVRRCSPQVAAGSPQSAAVRGEPPQFAAGKEGKGREGISLAAADSPQHDRPPRSVTSPPLEAPAGLMVAVLDACGIDHERATRSAARAHAKAIAELAQAGATPDDVPTAVRAYRARYPNAAVTPTALARHWPELHTTPARASPYRPWKSDGYVFPTSTRSDTP